MDEPHDQQADPARTVQAGKCDSARESHIGNQDKDCRNKLQKCPVYPLHLLNELIEQNNGRVKTGSAQPKKDTDEMIVPGRQIPKPCDQYNTKRGHKEADPLLCCHLFPE